MRLSSGFIPTLKEIPSDAVIPSHQLMLRAGLIRMLASGIYSYLPLGWKVMRKIIQIIREEMEAIGAQEFYLPALNPMEIWEETGRASDFGDEMFRLKDRRKHSMVLAPTHEEVICDIARREIRSYKELPQIWYQIQPKFRDEPRPRSGVLRARQFIMKDSYSLDADEKGLDQSYQKHAEAYKKIFTRCGLQFFIVGASSGLMGGSASQEFMVESEAGEDTVAICQACGYAANVEVAQAKLATLVQEDGQLEEVHTPNRRTIEEVSEFLSLPPERFIKSLLYIIDSKPAMLLVRGDHELNESKMIQTFGPKFRPATPEEVQQYCGASIGFIGPIGLKNVPIYADLTIKGQKGFVTGANKDHYHIKGIDVERDIEVQEYVDISTVLEGEGCPECDHPLRVVKAIEIGHIFKLGTKYSLSMGATVLNEEGKQVPIVMGSYGIGIERIVAAYIEQNHDERGIIWNKALAPYLLHIIPINLGNKQIAQATEKTYGLLTEEGYDVLLDDRDVSAGVKFYDADLIGTPIQIIISEKNLKNDRVEVRLRRTGEAFLIPANDLLSDLKQILKKVE